MINHAWLLFGTPVRNARTVVLVTTTSWFCERNTYARTQSSKWNSFRLRNVHSKHYRFVPERLAVILKCININAKCAKNLSAYV